MLYNNKLGIIDSEWLLLRKTDQFVVNRVTVNTTNPNHP